jgi:hypothetical protein
VDRLRAELGQPPLPTLQETLDGRGAGCVSFFLFSSYVFCVFLRLFCFVLFFFWSLVFFFFIVLARARVFGFVFSFVGNWGGLRLLLPRVFSLVGIWGGACVFGETGFVSFSSCDCGEGVG